MVAWLASRTETAGNSIFLSTKEAKKAKAGFEKVVIVITLYIFQCQSTVISRYFFSFATEKQVLQRSFKQKTRCQNMVKTENFYVEILSKINQWSNFLSIALHALIYSWNFAAGNVPGWFSIILVARKTLSRKVDVWWPLPRPRHLDVFADSTMDPEVSNHMHASFTAFIRIIRTN